ncbi:hypothetical protein CEUSTIGMA_g9075.t1 [Chlamydomonas eustigma]|uniref:Limiting CO2-inducible protein B/C beta carbonyic anhydrase domain-containing protein n=1 Tax=Chlamydomonas eustigma TaxID=1157962 RepID=A0A250XEZ6_9CHLO|nr:hypothetical protein CEUSTIGMA_g9075.t1 [Chlamydomonas eustigma]|eukprot:GAX81647.1 hypothetical protein CEUSTIGMA_g9075.t1 [Chlamydomonas eustigma]
MASTKASWDENNLNARHSQVAGYFPTALGVDDFIARVEVVLSGFGFNGDNSIAMTNLCRDEVTTILKDKIEAVFGGSFNTNGLGAVLTCGVTGMKAGLSHSPTISGRERYVFFSFPHIAIDSQGNIGTITRPGRDSKSCACGALQKCLNEFRAEGYDVNCKVPGEHDPLDPEYSILKQRLARRLRYERSDTSKLDLPSITALAERTITNDLEYLLEKVIDTNQADYAVVTGVQIHNWATALEQGGMPSLEFVAFSKCYVVVNGQKMHINLVKVPPLSPRQLLALASGNGPVDKNIAVSHSVGATLQEIPFSYLSSRLPGATAPAYHTVQANSGKALDLWPGWQNVMRSHPTQQERDINAPNVDDVDQEGKEAAEYTPVAYPSFQVPSTLLAQDPSKWSSAPEASAPAPNNSAAMAIPERK